MPKVTERHTVVRELLEVMTKEELADKMKVSIFTILAWRDARRKPNFATFYLLKRIHKQRVK